MKIAFIWTFSAVASYTISAVSHRSALKKSLFTKARQPSMTEAEILKMGGKISENFLENRAIFYAKGQSFGKPKTEVTICPVSKIPPSKPLLIQELDEKEQKKNQ